LTSDTGWNADAMARQKFGALLEVNYSNLLFKTQLSNSLGTRECLAAVFAV